MERLLDRVGRPSREPQRGEHAERHGAPVREVEVGRSLERVRERVPEVQRPANAAVERVADAERGLVGRAAPDELGVGQLPEPLAGEQPGLHDLGHPVQALGGGQRLDAGPGRSPSARASGRRRSGSFLRAGRSRSCRRWRRRLVRRASSAPGPTAQPRRKVAAAKPAASVTAPPPSARIVSFRPNSQRAPESFHFRHGLGTLARRQLVRLDELRAERELGIGAVDAVDDRLADQVRHAHPRQARRGVRARPSRRGRPRPPARRRPRRRRARRQPLRTAARAGRSGGGTPSSACASGRSLERTRSQAVSTSTSMTTTNSSRRRSRTASVSTAPPPTATTRGSRAASAAPSATSSLLPKARLPFLGEDLGSGADQLVEIDELAPETLAPPSSRSSSCRRP